MNRPEVILLLTATLDPGDMAYVQRNNPNLRREDYRNSLLNFLAEPATPPIVFCENSGSDLCWAKELFETFNPYNKQLELISFCGNDYPRHRGKGYGEIGIIAHALTHSRILRPDTRILKITGRYFVSNIGVLMKRITSALPYEVMVDLRGNLSWSDSRVFYATSAFLRSYLLPLLNEADDSEGMTFEVLLARAVHLAMSHRKRWAMLPCAPIIRGVSATSGNSYKSGVLSNFKREAFRYLKQAVLSR